MRDQRFAEAARALGYTFDGEIKIGGNYVPLVRDGDVRHLSGLKGRCAMSASSF